MSPQMIHRELSICGVNIRVHAFGGKSQLEVCNQVEDHLQKRIDFFEQGTIAILERVEVILECPAPFIE
jgi:hypothetical protein